MFLTTFKKIFDLSQTAAKGVFEVAESESVVKIELTRFYKADQKRDEEISVSISRVGHNAAANSLPLRRCHCLPLSLCLPLTIPIF